MSYQFVLTSVADGVGTLTLNRPDRLNAVDPVMARELVGATGDLLGDSSVRTVIITGAGRAFSAGGDVKFLGNAINGERYDDAMSLVRAGGQLAKMIRESPKPVLASLNGVAAGGGANLALACDLRIAADTAGIGQVFHRIGLHPDWGGSYFLPRLVGTARALELIWTAEIIPAARCLELGLVNQVVPQSAHECDHRRMGRSPRRTAADRGGAGQDRRLSEHGERTLDGTGPRGVTSGDMLQEP